MCTVTYIPANHNGFILTSNRDESPQRPHALAPQKYSIHSVEVTFPKDPEGGGTWIASSNLFTLCLLNGADKYHSKAGPYLKSRGIVLLDFFLFNDVDLYAEKEDFSQIEPFTLVVVQHDIRRLFQLRWNGAVLDKKKLNAEQPMIWSSHTLYTEDVISQREDWFADFVGANELTPLNMLNFHRFGGTGNIEHDLVMSRQGRVQTVSITQIECLADHHLVHIDLINELKTLVHV